MPEIDPVILQLKAENDRYIAELRRTTRTAEQQLGLQEKRVKKLEAEFRSSSSKIALSLKGLAGTLATYFTGRELVGLLDSFTRLQNNLRVAGLEGESLAAVQQSLLSISQRYGVELESLTSVYLKASLAQKELGASTDQIVNLNEIVAASLKITGTSAAEAQGALLQLGQALGSGVVRAEEFNSLLEGALPLVQAAARGIERYGGSVAKLRADVADGNVTSREFFEGVLRGGVQTIADAEKATLTLSGGVTALTSALTVYFGEADKASGVSAALGYALSTLADNLDTIIPALAAVAGFLGVRYVAGAVAASGATRALIAHLAIATTSLEGTALAARSAGASLLAALGGPVGAAILAVGAALYLVHQRTSDLDQATGRYKDGLVASNKISDHARELAQKLASARGEERVATINALNAEKARAQQALVSARADIVAARAAYARARAVNAAQTAASAGYGGAAGAAGSSAMRIVSEGGVATAKANQTAAEESYAIAAQAIKDIEAAISAGTGNVATPGTTKKSKRGPKGPTGPSAAEIAQRHAEEIARLELEELQAKLALTEDARDRADIQREMLFDEYKLRSEQLKNEENFTDDQKAAQQAYLDRIYGYEQGANGEIVVKPAGPLVQAVNRERDQQLAREAADIAEERFRAEQDALRLQYDMAQTEADRKRIALQILEAEDAYLREKLQAVIDAHTINGIQDQQAKIAQIQLDAVNETAAARREATNRQFRAPLGRYADDAVDEDTRVQEAAARRIRKLNEDITDAITEELGIDDPFIKDLFSIFLDKNIFGPLAEALDEASQGEGGLIGAASSLIGSLFGGGRATGGPVTPGKHYMVNEKSTAPGLFFPLKPGVIQPPDQSIARPSPVSAGGAPTIYVDARGAVMNDQFAAQILSKSKEYAAEAGGRAYQRAVKDAPGAVQNFKRYGTI